ncbi:SODIUM/HYDROGEN EXCHANGER [Salix purpurea]|uniref:SODIUM/HYDROGEN EXCHANGER n=1 Tax=Salix purpurea TaxID=77065 RepID=A0A9Q1A9F3_SALPP|nr:SODIUM/HYDROGEN EXCHANGER [Salix purpurea]
MATKILNAAMLGLTPENMSSHEHLPSALDASLLNTSIVITLCVFFALLCACIVIGHLLEENRWANESITALLLGLCAGVVVLLIKKGESSHLMKFSEDLFFLYLLPPIIFNAGFQVKKKRFFKNFTTILLFGIFGTVISFCVISLGVFWTFKKIGVRSLNIKDHLAIGAIMSATDSVCTLQVLSQDETPFLYSIVFGEALKLIGTFLYLFFTSTALGLAAGLLSAFIIKTLYFGRHSTDREFALMILMAYLPYLLAELLNLSGILTVFFCGIVMSHYTWHNVTESSRITTKHAFATISFIAETFIFLYVGMDALDIDKWRESKASAGTSAAVSSTLFALVLVGRAAFIFPLANILNCFQKIESSKIHFKQQFIIWWAGLMRGAVTIALSYNQFASSVKSSPESALMITSTIIVVLFSTIVCGSVTKPLIEAVLLRHRKPMVSDLDDNVSLEELRVLLLESGDPNNSNNNQPARRASSLRLLISHPTTTVHYFWRKFDDKFMRPVFGGRGFVPFVPSTPTGAADDSSSA